jgi:glycopeptide antibiotics resistance protein
VVDFDAVAWGAGMVPLVVVLILMRSRGWDWPHLAALSVFWLYAFGVVKVAFFAIPVSGSMAEAFASEGGSFWSTVNLVPGRFAGFETLAIKQSAYNVLMALPFGFGLPFLVRVSWRRAAWSAVLFGTTIECLQLLISLAIGFPYRVVDINDLLFNGLGVILGFALFRFLARLVLAAEAGWDPSAEGRVATYLVEVARRSSGAGS